MKEGLREGNGFVLVVSAVCVDCVSMWFVTGQALGSPVLTAGHEADLSESIFEPDPFCNSGVALVGFVVPGGSLGDFRDYKALSVSEKG